MRQLSYEAITVAVAAIRQRVEPHQEGQLKRLPPQERDERIKRQAASITGFVIQGDYEPAHSVVDFFTIHVGGVCSEISAFVKMHQPRAGANAPSRGEDSKLRDRGAAKVTVVWQEVRETIGSWISQEGKSRQQTI